MSHARAVARKGLSVAAKATSPLGGFGAHYTIIIVRNPQNSIGTYLGPCTRVSLLS